MRALTEFQAAADEARSDLDRFDVVVRGARSDEERARASWAACAMRDAPDPKRLDKAITLHDLCLEQVKAFERRRFWLARRARIAEEDLLRAQAINAAPSPTGNQ